MLEVMEVELLEVVEVELVEVVLWNTSTWLRLTEM